MAIYFENLTVRSLCFNIYVKFHSDYMLIIIRLYIYFLYKN